MCTRSSLRSVSRRTSPGRPTIGSWATVVVRRAPRAARWLRARSTRALLRAVSETAFHRGSEHSRSEDGRCRYLRLGGMVFLARANERDDAAGDGRRAGNAERHVPEIPRVEG